MAYEKKVFIQCLLIKLLLPLLLMTSPLVGPQPVSPYQLARLIARLFGFDPKEVKKGSLLAYQKNQPPGSRPWQKNLAISNRKITSLGLKITSLKEALLRIKGKVKGTFE